MNNIELVKHDLIFNYLVYSYINIIISSSYFISLNLEYAILNIT